ncbi:MAG TPA: hypothetical protein VGZ90_13265 [Puia sp.]|jgi:hypothetical protein|nr:hypothetical protein [Puia sp.]
MLEAIGRYNHISEKTREELQARLQKAGKLVEYRFDISHFLPDIAHDGENEVIVRSDKKVYPRLYTLRPVTFNIIDKHSKQSVLIGLPNGSDESDANFSVARVSVPEYMRGLLSLDLTNTDNWDMFALLELHPEHENGMYQNKNMKATFRRVDKLQDAQQSYSKREQRADAVAVARNKNQQEVRDFAAAMGWDETEDYTLLKDQVLQMAEEDTAAFAKVEQSNISYAAAIKRAMNRQVIEFVPLENKFVWGSNKQTIAALERSDGTMKGIIDRFKDWLETSKNGEEIYNRMLSLMKPEKATAAKAEVK